MEKKAVILSGLPASGKSTLVDQLKQADEFGEVHVHSTDNIIQLKADSLGLTYNDVFKTTIDTATKQASAALSESMKQGKYIVWDQTNLSVSKRRKAFSRLKSGGYEVTLLQICIPLTQQDWHIWHERLTSRKGKNIPEDVLQKMLDGYEPGSIDECDYEGYILIDMHGNKLKEVLRDG